jgi:RNA polymerase sigma factor (sigma-70 family)
MRLNANISKIDEEVDLFKSYQSGSPKSFALIFDEWYLPAFYYALSFLDSTQDAEEITDECFMVIWKRRQSFKNLAQCKSYLFSCIHNASINQLRSRKKMLAFTKEWEYLASQDLYLPTFSPQLPQLHMLLTSLTPTKQQVFKMIYAEGKTEKETAKAMNLSVNTVRNHKQQGFFKLRKALKQVWEGLKD